MSKDTTMESQNNKGKTEGREMYFLSTKTKFEWYLTRSGVKTTLIIAKIFRFSICGLSRCSHWTACKLISHKHIHFRCYWNDSYTSDNPSNFLAWIRVAILACLLRRFFLKCTISVVYIGNLKAVMQILR